MALLVAYYCWNRVLEGLDAVVIATLGHQLIQFTSLANFVCFWMKRATFEQVQLQTASNARCNSSWTLRKPEDFIALASEEKYFLTPLARVIVHRSEGQRLIDLVRFYAIKLLCIIINAPVGKQCLLLIGLCLIIWHST